MSVKFGVFVPQGWRMDLVDIADPIEQFEAMTAVARAADADPAWDSIWVYDHFHTVPEPTLETTFECWTISATLARDTERVRIGQMVGCNGYRNPALYAKIASTVDVASHGRLDAGIGAGWYEHEWLAYGYGFPDAPERLRMLREACKVIRAMWSEDYATYEGQRYQINGAINEPKGASGPPPLWIGGGGEKVTLKLVAQYADACNVGGDPSVISHKLDVLRGHCETVGRNYDDIIKSTEIFLLPVPAGVDRDRFVAEAPSRLHLNEEEFARRYWVGTSDEIAERLQSTIATGIEYVIFYIPGLAYGHDAMHQVAQEVIPHFR